MVYTQFHFERKRQLSFHDTLNGKSVLNNTVVSKAVYKGIQNSIITPPAAQLNFLMLHTLTKLQNKETYSLQFRVALTASDVKLRDVEYKELLNK